MSNSTFRQSVRSGAQNAPGLKALRTRDAERKQRELAAKRVQGAQAMERVFVAAQLARDVAAKKAEVVEDVAVAVTDDVFDLLFDSAAGYAAAMGYPPCFAAAYGQRFANEYVDTVMAGGVTTVPKHNDPAAVQLRLAVLDRHDGCDDAECVAE